MNALLLEKYEVPVSSTEVLEANVASIRVDLNELKMDFRAAVVRIDSDIKGAVRKAEAEIRAMAARAEKDLQQLADRFDIQLSDLRTDISDLRADHKRFEDRVETQFSELRADHKSLREKVDRNYEKLYTKIDTDIKETNKTLAELSKVVIKIDSRLSAIIWVGGGLVALVPIAITVAKAFKWI